MTPLLNYLDVPVRFLVFTVPEAMGLIGPFVWGIFYQQFWIGALGSCVGYGLARFVMHKFPRHIVRGFLYWHLPTRGRAYRCPVFSHVREYIVIMLCLSLVGCHSGYNNILDCPALRVARCQDMPSVYQALKCDVRNKPKVFVYYFETEEGAMEGKVLL